MANKPYVSAKELERQKEEKALLAGQAAEVSVDTKSTTVSTEAVVVKTEVVDEVLVDKENLQPATDLIPGDVAKATVDENSVPPTGDNVELTSVEKVGEQLVVDLAEKQPVVGETDSTELVDKSVKEDKTQEGDLTFVDHNELGDGALDKAPELNTGIIDQIVDVLGNGEPLKTLLAEGSDSTTLPDADDKLADASITATDTSTETAPVKDTTLPEGDVAQAGPAVTPLTETSENKPSTEGEEKAPMVKISMVRESEDDIAIRHEAEDRYGQGPIFWPISDCVDYLEKNIHPPKTLRGNWVRDTRRLNKLEAMEASEFEDFLDNALEFPPEFDQSLVWEELYRRYKLPGNVTREDAENYIRHSTAFPATPDGLLLNDTVRNAKDITFWSYPELRAALLKQIETPYSAAELMSRLKATLGVSDRFSDTQINKTLEEEKFSTMKTLVLSSNLEEYATLRKSRTTPQAHALAHVNLFRVIKKLFTREYHEFKESWTMLLDFVKKEENTIFTPQRAFEHWSHLTLSKTDQRALEDVITLLQTTCSPIDRNKGVSEQYIVNLTQHLCTDDQRQMLMAYYSKK